MSPDPAGMVVRLMSDVVGSTAMADRLGPEAAERS